MDQTALVIQDIIKHNFVEINIYIYIYRQYINIKLKA